MTIRMFASTGKKNARKGSFFKSKISSKTNSGQFIPPAVRIMYEKNFSTDFSAVKIHNDPAATFFCEKLEARAFTFGNDIFFNAKEYSPQTITGQYLLAHELAHIKLHSNSREKTFRQSKKTPITGFDTETYVYKIGNDLNQVILYLLNNSKLVKAYYKGNLAKADWPTSKFIIHEFDQDFADTYNKFYPGNKDDPQKIGGFYHRKSDTMNLKRLSRLGHALHESVHRMTDKKSLGYIGSFLIEGITQLISDIILIENNLKKETDLAYQANVACANKLIEISDVDKLFSHYFTYDKGYITFLAEKIKKKKLIPPVPQNLVGC